MLQHSPQWQVESAEHLNPRLRVFTFSFLLYFTLRHSVYADPEHREHRIDTDYVPVVEDHGFKQSSYKSP